MDTLITIFWIIYCICAATVGAFAAHIARVEYKKDLLLTCLAFLSAALAWVPLAFLLRRLYVLEEAEEKQFSENSQ